MFEGPMIWQSIILFLFRIFELACCIAMVVRFWGSVSGLLGGLAFGTFFVIGMLRALLHQGLAAGWIVGEGAYWVEWLLWEHGYIFMIINLIAYGLLFAAILTAPVGGGRSASYRPVPVGPASVGGGGGVSYRPAPAGPISKGFYLGSILGSLGVSAFFSVISLIFTASDEPLIGLAIVGLGFPLMIYGVVVLMVLIYKMWATLEGKGARTTPGKAVGFLFIPFFNAYWIFQVYWGWAKDFNAYTGQQNMDVPRISEGLALAICITTFCSMVPYIGLLLALPNLVLVGLFLAKACDGMNAMAWVEQNPPSDADAATGLGGMTP